MRRVIVSHRAQEGLLDYLRREGFDPILSQPNQQVDARISDHPDLFVFADGECLIVDPWHYDHYARNLPDKPLVRGTLPATGLYPADTRYNALVVGGCLIHGPETDPRILERYTDRIPVKQGYVRCSLLPVDDQSLITSDRGLARALSHRYEVLTIEPGTIGLPGFPYGFIGGASGCLDPLAVHLTGDPGEGTEGSRIRKFCEKHRRALCYPAKLPWLDLGSLIPVDKQGGK